MSRLESFSGCKVDIRPALLGTLLNRIIGVDGLDFDYVLSCLRKDYLLINMLVKGVTKNKDTVYDEYSDYPIFRLTYGGVYATYESYLDIIKILEYREDLLSKLLYTKSTLIYGTKLDRIDRAKKIVTHLGDPSYDNLLFVYGIISPKTHAVVSEDVSLIELYYEGLKNDIYELLDMIDSEEQFNKLFKYCINEQSILFKNHIQDLDMVDILSIVNSNYIRSDLSDSQKVIINNEIFARMDKYYMDKGRL